MKLSALSTEEMYRYEIERIEEHFLEGQEEVRNRLYYRICPVCGKTFNTRNFKMIFCCNQHATEYLYNTIRKKSLTGKIKTCKHCGIEFESNGRFCFCSELCKKKRSDKQIETRRKEQPPGKPKKKKSLEELMYIQDKIERDRLFNDKMANAYIKTGKGFNL